jgi:1,4-dihydroxy-2-naphthoate octaprenyltransferase
MVTEIKFDKISTNQGKAVACSHTVFDWVGLLVFFVTSVVFQLYHNY